MRKLVTNRFDDLYASYGFVGHNLKDKKQTGEESGKKCISSTNSCTRLMVHICLQFNYLKIEDKIHKCFQILHSTPQLGKFCTNQ